MIFTTKYNIGDELFCIKCHMNIWYINPMPFRVESIQIDVDRRDYGENYYNGHVSTNLEFLFKFKDAAREECTKRNTPSTGG